MHVAVACGGTGGHIFPGLATARVLLSRGHRVTLWLAGREVENRSVMGWEGEVVRLRASAPASSGWRRFPSALQLALTPLEARRRMRRARPDVILGMGSYASIGPCAGAWSLRIPVVLHEANAVPGRAISMLSHVAAAVALGFDAAREFFPRRMCTTTTGIPLREGFSMPERPLRDDGVLTLLVMGGSQGARVFNERMPESVARLFSRTRGGVRVIHLAGDADADRVRERYRAQGVDARVEGFCPDMPGLYAAADLAVTRAGAATCAELAAFGLPALLVPLPHASRDHQMRNARAMEAAGGVRVLPETEFSADAMAGKLADLALDPDGRLKMKQALMTVFPHDGAIRLANMVEQIGAHPKALAVVKRFATAWTYRDQTRERE